MTTVRTDLLALLADYLEKNVKPEEFDLTYWKCGTTCCAMGHAANIPEFKHEGFKLIAIGYSQKTFMPTIIDENGGAVIGMDAVVMLLGITCADAEYLFVDDEYPNGPLTTPKEVAERIRAFIEDENTRMPR